MAIQTLINRGDSGRFIFKKRHIQIEEYDALVQFAAGDARKALNLIDLIASTFEADTLKYRDQCDCGQGGAAEYCPL